MFSFGRTNIEKRNPMVRILIFNIFNIYVVVEFQTVSPRSRRFECAWLYKLFEIIAAFFHFVVFNFRKTYRCVSYIEML